MANIILLKSSILCSCIHIVFMTLYPPDILYGTFLGFALLTSVLNHRFTLPCLKWLDRGTMYAGSAVTLYMAHQLHLRILTGCIGVAYALAKLHQSVRYHILAHLLITGINANILYLYTNEPATKQ